MLRRLLLCFWFAAAVLPLRADEPARFFIERIDVRGIKRVSAPIVVAESTLRAGAEYSEQELREGSLRVNRAPYLLSADFSLEKGSERGKYVLVITVNETKPFFYVFDGVFYIPHDPFTRVDYFSNVQGSDNDIAVGFRFFVGPRGAIHFGVQGTADNRSYTSDYSAFAVGYTQYDLFGTRAFATINIKRLIEGSPGGTEIDPQFVLGVPLSRNQTLTLDYDQSSLDRLGSFSQVRQTQRVVTLKWSYNTTNHPVLPTSGTVLTVTPVAVWNDHEGADIIIFDPPKFQRIPYNTHDRSYGLEGTAARYWEIGERNSVGGGIGGGFAHTHERGLRLVINRLVTGNVNSYFANADLTASHSFWSQERVAKQGDQRLQLDVHLGRRVDDARFPSYFLNRDAHQASISWVRRNAWGTARLGVGYAW